MMTSTLFQIVCLFAVASPYRAKCIADCRTSHPSHLLLLRIHGIDPLLYSALGFFVGLYLGNWMALDKDRSIEYSSAVKPIREQLLKDIECPAPQNNSPIGPVELDFLDNYIWWWRRKSLRAALNRVSECRQAAYRRNEYGESTYADTAAIVDAMKGLLSHLRLRS
jgi:hypothetical protein